MKIDDTVDSAPVLQTVEVPLPLNPAPAVAGYGVYKKTVSVPQGVFTVAVETSDGKTYETTYVASGTSAAVVGGIPPC